MSADPRDLHRALEAAKILRRNIAVLAAGDEQAVQDTFDGETTLEAEIRAAVIANDDDEIIIDGIKMRESDLRSRRRLAEARVEARRGFIEQAMNIAGWSTHRADIATVTVGAAKPRLEIDEEASIPSQFWKRQDPALDTSSVLAVLMERHRAIQKAHEIDDRDERAARLKQIDEAHPEIPGCRLETGGVTLTVRRK